MIFIEESGMSFGPFYQSRLFHIEKSPACNKFNEQLKLVEFIFIRNNTIIFLEEKSSFAQESNKFDFDKNIRDIEGKIKNAMSLFLSSRLGRNKEIFDELPMMFKEIDVSKCRLTFYLVLKGFDTDALGKINDALIFRLSNWAKCWGIKGTWIGVLNEAEARKKQLIQ